MKLIKFTKYINLSLTSALFVLLFSVINLTHQEKVEDLTAGNTEISSKQQQQNDVTRIETTSSNDVQESYHAPFIVLMSKDSISVAQLPMIEYGNLTTVYRLDDSNIVREGNNIQDDDQVERNEGQPDDDDETEGFFGTSRPGVIADAREYEQMPHVGKSGWQQQIVHGVSVDEIGPRISEGPAVVQQTEDVSTRGNRKDVREGQEREEAKLPRKRRRRRRSLERERRWSGNSLTDDEGSSIGGGSVEATAGRFGSVSNSAVQMQPDAQTEPVARSRGEEATAAESSKNVTSARFAASDHRNQNPTEGNAKLAERDSGTDSAPTSEGGDKNSQTQPGPDEASFPSLPVSSHSTGSHNTNQAIAASNVQFCDFDVHISLGYAFAADSTGRIHRFKLLNSPSSSADAAAAASLKAQNLNRGYSRTPGRIGTYIAQKNDADPATGSDSSNKIDAADGKFEFSSQLNSKSTNSGRKYSRSTAELHTDFGHVDEKDSSSSSGDSNRVNNSNVITVDKQGEDVTHEQSGNNWQHPTISGHEESQKAAESLIVTPISGESQHYNGHQSNFINEAEPKIIWRRSSRSPSRTSSNNKRPILSKGALSLNDGSQVADLSSAKSGQVVDASFGSSQASFDRRIEDTASAGATSKTMLEHQRRPELRTEIAVDWLSNLLFVLDKYRLFVVDFDGNNELVLIDDFNANNRPTDIKLDPMNNFLFWLQVGRFHNTIYKLDLSVLSMPTATQRLIGNTLRLRQMNNKLNINSNNNSNGIVNFDTSEFVALISHHYAHPIITNLPRHTKLFTIDHKHSRIYVPLVPATNVAGTSDNQNPNFDLSQNATTQKDETEVFALSDNITHLNNTGSDFNTNSEQIEMNCTTTSKDIAAGGSILAYNLDGTDVGPLRTVDDKSHIKSLDDMQDFTVDSEKSLFYWLTNGGRELFEEYKDGMSIFPAQHNLDGKSYMKLIYFNSNGHNQQPLNQRPRFKIREIMHELSNSIFPNRLGTRDTNESLDRQASSLNDPRHRNDLDTDPAGRYAKHTPFIILGIVCLVVISIYLIYSFIFYQVNGTSNNVDQCRNGSISGDSSCSAGSREGADMSTGGFHHSSTISKWIARPSGRDTLDTSTFDHNSNSAVGQTESCDFESNNYEASNAIDEHYRESIISQQQGYDSMIGLNATSQLANLSQWPSNVHDLSNKLYVPVEFTQDEALSSIHRISIDQLAIERKAPLGEGHFGTVLQGTLKCTMNERGQLLNRSCNLPSSPSSSMQPSQLRPRIPTNSTASSSGHGSSSSTSCEFVTANSCLENNVATNQTDYLTPRSYYVGGMSDYVAENQVLSSEAESYSSYGDKATDQHLPLPTSNLKVAIKKLKDKASTQDKRDFLQEAKLLANFDHPNIVQLIGICLDRGSTLIVMELMLGGDLIRYMQENYPDTGNQSCQQTDHLTYDDLLKICLDIVNGCCYLEDLDYIHRDLAARNCLVSSRKREERIVKLADFGLARDIYKNSYYKKLNDSDMPLKWMAPECLKEQKFTKKSDVWSFGVVMWEVMSYCREELYKGVAPFLLMEHLENGDRLRQPTNCDEDMYKLMNHCWQMEPEKRPTFNECRGVLIEIRSGRKPLDV